MTPYATCKTSEEHVAHMDLNGECPWCGAWINDEGDLVLAPGDVRVGPQ